MDCSTRLGLTSLTPFLWPNLLNSTTSDFVFFFLTHEIHVWIRPHLHKLLTARLAHLNTWYRRLRQKEKRNGRSVPYETTDYVRLYCVSRVATFLQALVGQFAFPQVARFVFYVTFLLSFFFFSPMFISLASTIKIRGRHIDTHGIIISIWSLDLLRVPH
jgi:hypothetical protein